MQPCCAARASRIGSLSRTALASATIAPRLDVPVFEKQVMPLAGLDCVERLLLIDAAEADGLTALHLAAIAGCHQFSPILIDFTSILIHSHRSYRFASISHRFSSILSIRIDFSSIIIDLIDSHRSHRFSSILSFRIEFLIDFSSILISFHQTAANPRWLKWRRMLCQHRTRQPRC